MSDLISRQAVLKLLSTIPPEEAMTKAMLIQSVKQMDSETVTECNNLISRQAAISLPPKPREDRYFQTQNLDDAYDYGWYSLQRCIEKLSSAQPEQQWIPCSERLPEEEEKSYWVCLDGGGQCQCRWTNNMYGLGANEWDKWGWHVMDKPQYSRIIAWRSLPEPYTEKVEE